MLTTAHLKNFNSVPRPPKPKSIKKGNSKMQMGLKSATTISINKDNEFQEVPLFIFSCNNALSNGISVARPNQGNADD